MPRIQDLLDGDLIIEDLQATDKAGVIREFAAFLKSRGKVRDEDELYDIIMRRESTTTGIGDGIAIPHGRIKDLAGVVVAFGRSRNGVDFHSMDGKPARLFFLFITPESRPEDHLAVLRRLARITRNPVLREQLLRSTDRREMQKLILDEDDKYSHCR
jgi:PTS system nitrogen regulatory IIA component